MDFEFSMLDHTNMVLISGAMSNSLDRYRTVKIEGKPLLLTKGRQVKAMSETQVIRAIKEINRIFRNKEDLRVPVLEQMKRSIQTKTSNLGIKYIRKYLEKGKTNPIIVLWNGSTDREILERLSLGHYKVLEITCYDVDNNQRFYLQLRNIKTKRVILSEEVGHVDKTGRLLNLMETHNLVCNKNHNITYAHDPCTDVTITKCLFDKLMRVCRRRGIQVTNYL